jgi:hypothetical protein
MTKKKLLTLNTLTLKTLTAEDASFAKGGKATSNRVP